MRTVRTAVALAGALLLAGGYTASVLAFFFGDPAAYARALDESAVAWVSLFLLCAAVVLALLPGPKEPPS